MSSVVVGIRGKPFAFAVPLPRLLFFGHWPARIWALVRPLHCLTPLPSTWVPAGSLRVSLVRALGLLPGLPASLETRFAVMPVDAPAVGFVSFTGAVCLNWADASAAAGSATTRTPAPITASRLKPVFRLPAGRTEFIFDSLSGWPPGSGARPLTPRCHYVWGYRFVQNVTNCLHSTNAGLGVKGEPSPLGGGVSTQSPSVGSRLAPRAEHAGDLRREAPHGLDRVALETHALGRQPMVAKREDVPGGLRAFQLPERVGRIRHLRVLVAVVHQLQEEAGG